MTVETETTPLQQDLQDALRHSLAEQGQDAPHINAEQLRALSSTMARLLAVRMGSRSTSIREAREARDAAVFQAFNGRNRDDVMQHFGISRRLFYNIISRAPYQRK